MSLFVSPIIRALDANGNPLPGATLTFYQSGTLVLADVYTTSALTTPHSNPVVADAGGLFAPIYLDPNVTYRVILKTAGGVTIQDIDPYSVGASGEGIASSYTWATAQTSFIPASVNLIQLQDRGRPILERVTAEPVGTGETYCKLRSVDRYMPDETTDSTNGGWWRVAKNQIVTPAMWGCTSTDSYNHGVTALSSLPDDKDRLNDFYAFIAHNRCLGANIGGVYGATGDIYEGRASDTGDSAVNDANRTLDYYGDFRLVAKGPYPVMMHGRNLRNINLHGHIHFYPIGAGAYSSRENEVGLLLTGESPFFHFNRIHGRYFKGALIAGNTISPAGNIQNGSFGIVDAYACGSGSQDGTVGTSWGLTVNATIYAAALVADSGSTGQRTTMQLAAAADLPPTWLEAYGSTADAEGQMTIFACITNSDGKVYPYKVKGIDRTNNRITIFPALDPALSGTIQIRYAWGGALWFRGGDSGLMTFKQVYATYCGIGANLEALYGVSIDILTTQGCLVDQSWGQTTADAQRGTRIGTYYTEDSDIRLVIGSGNRGTIYGYIEQSTGDFDFSRVFVPSPRLLPSGAFTESEATQGVQIGFQGIMNRWSRYTSETQTLRFDRPDSENEITVFNNAGVTFNIEVPNSDLYRLFGYDTAYVNLLGTDAGYTSGGSAVFVCPTGWTINGGTANVTITDGAAPARTVIRISNFAAKQIIIARMSS